MRIQRRQGDAEVLRATSPVVFRFVGEVIFEVWKIKDLRTP
jgi:hypothetical protein